jgi:hypothetical protein
MGAKLNMKIAREIRFQYAKATAGTDGVADSFKVIDEMIEKYGVGSQTILDIIRGVSWKERTARGEVLRRPTTSYAGSQAAAEGHTYPRGIPGALTSADVFDKFVLLDTSDHRELYGCKSCGSVVVNDRGMFDGLQLHSDWHWNNDA